MIKPSIEQIQAYLDEKGHTWSAEDFYNHHESKGWVVGKAPMQKWKSAVATWNKNNQKQSMTKAEQEGQAIQIKFRDDREDRLFAMIEKLWLNYGVSSFQKDRRIVGVWYDFILMEEKKRANYYENFIRAGVHWMSVQDRMPNYAQIKANIANIPSKEYKALPEFNDKNVANKFLKMIREKAYKGGE